MGIWFILIMFSCVLSNVVFGATIENLKLNLTRNEYGAEQNFAGTVNFNMNGEVDSITPVIFKVAGIENIGSSFKEMMDFLNLGTLMPEDNVFQAAKSSVTVKLDSAGNKTAVGIDFSKAAEVKSIDFDVVGKGINGLKLDFKNDGTIDWRYVGELLAGTFSSNSLVYFTNDSYISNFATVGRSIPIEGEAGSQVFCEIAEVQPTKEYVIQAKVGMQSPGGKLRAALVDGEVLSSYTPGDCYDAVNKPDSNIYCCDLDVKSGNAADANCSIRKEINSIKDVSVCVFSEADSSGVVGNYSIGQEADHTGDAKGYFNGNLDEDGDFLIRIFSHKFNTTLSTTAKVSLSAEDVSKAEIQAKEKTVITMLGDNAGEVEFKNLKAVGVAQAGYQMDIVSFSPVIANNERVNYSGNVSVPLSFFKKIFSPKTNRLDYGLVAKINNVNSNEVRFRVVSGPDALIKVDNPVPAIGDTVTFDASGSQPVSADRKIMFYSWDFGDNKTINTAVAKHTFTQDGRFEIRLIVIDSEGIAGTKTLIMTVEGLSSSIIDQINSSLVIVVSSIDKIEKSNSAVKAAANSLGLIAGLNSAKVNLTELLKKAVSINGDSSLNESQKTPKYADIKKQVDNILKGIPSDLQVSVTKFEAQVDSASSIPSAKKLNIEDIDNFVAKVLKAQEDIVVKSEATKISIQYQSGDKSDFILIKKTISGGSGVVYEILPSGLVKKEIMTKDAQLVTPDGDIFRVAGASEIVYSASGDLIKATQTKTLVIPQDLSAVKITPVKEELQQAGECGNSICELGETISCQKDCGSERPWLLIIITLIVGALGVGAVYYFMIFKPNKNLGFEKNLFKTEKDHETLKKYIDDAMHVKRFTEQQISIVLKKKGWNDEQIARVISEVKSEKAKPVSIKAGNTGVVKK